SHVAPARELAHGARLRAVRRRRTLAPRAFAGLVCPAARRRGALAVAHSSAAVSGNRVATLRDWTLPHLADRLAREPQHAGGLRVCVLRARAAAARERQHALVAAYRLCRCQL